MSILHLGAHVLLKPGAPEPSTRYSCSKTADEISVVTPPPPPFHPPAFLPRVLPVEIHTIHSKWYPGTVRCMEWAYISLGPAATI